MNNNKVIWLIPLLLMLGCATSRIDYSWKSDEVLSRKYNKILVLTVNRGTDVNLRQRMELHLSDDLKGIGYNAVSAMAAYGPKAFRHMSEDTVIEKMAHSGFDAVMTIALLDKEKERSYFPGRVYYQPHLYLYYRHFWPYYTTVYDRVYTPGYYTTNTRYVWESNLYDVTTKELMYSVRTSSFDPVSSESLAHEYGKMMLKDMVKSHVLARQESIVKEMQ